MAAFGMGSGHSFAFIIPDPVRNDDVYGVCTACHRLQAGARHACPIWGMRSEEHTSELQSLMRISYAVFCLKKTKSNPNSHDYNSPYLNNTNQTHNNSILEYY